MARPIAVALIGAAGLVMGNVVTAIGPAILSYGQKPLFATSEIYKDLRRENPLLETTISDQLLQRKLYYTFRLTEVTFKELKEDNVIINARSTTKVRNATDESQDYEHTVRFDETVTYESVTFRPQAGIPIVFDRNNLLALDSGGNPLKATFKLPKMPIGPHGSLEIESRYALTKPNKRNETVFVTNRFLNGPMTFRIKNEITDTRFKYAVSSLAFDLDLPEENDSTNNEKTVTIPGPLFSGQGLSFNWDTK